MSNAGMPAPPISCLLRPLCAYLYQVCTGRNSCGCWTTTYPTMHFTSAVHTPKCSRSSPVGTCITLEQRFKCFTALLDAAQLPDASVRHRNIPEESLPEVSQHRRPSPMSDTVPSCVPGGRVQLRPRADSAAFCGYLDPVGNHTLKAEEARKLRRPSDWKALAESACVAWKRSGLLPGCPHGLAVPSHRVRLSALLTSAG